MGPASRNIAHARVSRGVALLVVRRQRTSQAAVVQVQLLDVRRQVADVRGKRKAWLITREVNLLAARLHFNERERQLACFKGERQGAR